MKHFWAKNAAAWLVVIMLMPLWGLFIWVETFDHRTPPTLPGNTPAAATTENGGEGVDGSVGFDVGASTDNTPTSIPDRFIPDREQDRVAIPRPAPSTLTLDGPGPHNIPAGVWSASIDAVDGLTILCDEGAVFDGLGTLQHFVQGSADDVTIDGCEVTNYASRDPGGGMSSQYGAINARQPGPEPAPLDTQGVNWTLSNLHVHNNAGGGVLLSSGSTLTDSRIVDNADFGCTSHGGSRIQIVGNEFARNGHGWADNPGQQWNESGGCKLKHVTGSDDGPTVVHSNVFKDSVGPAIWCDIDCVDLMVTRNRIGGPTGSCVFIELSKDATVRNNVCDQAGSVNRGWFWEAGIMVAGSQRVTVTGNRVSRSYNGITVISQDRYDQNTLELRDDWRTDQITVSGNQIVGCQFSGVAHGDNNDPIVEDAPNGPDGVFTDPDVFNRVTWTDNEISDCEEVLQ